MASARDLAPPLLPCLACGPTSSGRASLGRRFCTGGAAGGGDLVREKSLVGHGRSRRRRHLRAPGASAQAKRMRGSRLPCFCVGNPGSGAAASLARHGRLAAVRAVDPVSRPSGRRDPVVVGGRRRLLWWSLCVIWRLPSSPVRRAAQPGRVALPLGHGFCTGGAAGGGDLVRAKSLAGLDRPRRGRCLRAPFPSLKASIWTDLLTSPSPRSPGRKP